MSVTIYRKSADGATSGVDAGKYGVVEPNHLSAPRNGHVYAQTPADSDIAQLENGMFVGFTVKDGEEKLILGGKYMVFNEEKLYDERLQSHRDYVMKATDFTNGVMVPRIILLESGDVFTTNTIKDGETLAAGDLLAPGSDGLLAKVSENGFAEVMPALAGGDSTLPDGVTPAVRVRVL